MVKFAIASAMTLAGMSAALADTPFITDGATPVEYGHYALELSTSVTHVSSGTEGVAPALEVDYGMLPDVQISVVTGQDFASAPGTPTDWGFHAATFAAKYRFLSEDDKGWWPALAFAPAVTAPYAADPGSRRASFFLPLWAQKSFGNWTVYGGGGFNTNPQDGGHDYWSYGAVAIRQLTSKWALGVEFAGETRSAQDGTETKSIGMGAIYNLSDTWVVCAMVNTGVENRADTNQYSYNIALGWTL